MKKEYFNKDPLRVKKLLCTWQEITYRIKRIAKGARWRAFAGGAEMALPESGDRPCKKKTVLDRSAGHCQKDPEREAEKFKIITYSWLKTEKSLL